MYRDNTLIPSEAIRLLALGLLATHETSYAELASEVRQFAGLIVGPSLDLIGAPISLLTVEGLIEKTSVETEAGETEDGPLRITAAGRQELIRLLTSNMRAPVSDINKLIITLKMRFLHILEPADQRLQVEIMVEMTERQLVRLTELRGRNAGAPGHLIDWLDHEIDQARQRLGWFQALQGRLA